MCRIYLVIATETDRKHFPVFRLSLVFPVMTERRESIAQDTVKKPVTIPSNKRVSLQLEISEKFSLDRDARDTHDEHEPWPQHFTKKQHHHHQQHVPRKSRRQSVISQELQAMGCLDWSNQNKPSSSMSSHHDHDHKTDHLLQVEDAHVRQLSGRDRRHSLMPEHPDGLNQERRQSTYPGVKAQLEAMQREEAEAAANLAVANKRKYSILAGSVENLTKEKSPLNICDDEETPNVNHQNESHSSENTVTAVNGDVEDVGNDISATSGSRDQPLTSQASQRLAQSTKLEDQINLQHLVELMRIFYEADENGSDGLDIDEFRAAFGKILGKGKNDQQMAIMFMKIDTNCDGTVDWDEFCTYMLLEYQEKEVMAGEKLQPFPYPLRLLHSTVREEISSITFLPSLHRHSHGSGSGSTNKSSVTGEGDGGSDGGEGCVEGRYVSVCRDGTLCFWKSNLTLQRTIAVDCGKPKLTWVTDMVVLSNVNKMFLSFTDNMMALYDLSTANCDCLVQIVALPYCVLTMDYWYDPKDFNRAVLVLGDSGGGVCIMEFNTATTCLFSSQQPGVMENHRIAFSELLNCKQDGLKVTYMARVHGDWVGKVKYCPTMGYMMSCSNDSSCSLYLVDLHGIKEGSMLKVRKGITSFDYCKEWNIIATGGLDRSVRYWNPYVTGKPIAVLKGHSTAILFIAINSSHGHVLSFSKDMELRVWSVQDQLCVQSCHRCQCLLPHPPMAFFLHPHTGLLMISTNQLGALEPSLEDEPLSGRGEVMSHERPLCAALYNENFSQVVSGCHGSVVSVWDVDTGEKTIQFSHCHGTMEITAMAFDPTGRRLITGGKDGSLKIWNFNNGACLSVLQNRYNAEITCISFMTHRIIVGGWSRFLIEYSDHRDPDDVIPKYWGEGIHKDDILCMSAQEPNTLVSASYDGDIIVWNLDVQRSVCRLNASDEKCRGSHWGSKSPTRAMKKTPSSCQEEAEVGSHLHGKEEHAVEKIAFLHTRENDPDSASLVACGTGGWVQMWNIAGGGLIGEFNIWDTKRHCLAEEERSLECVTALKIDSNDETMLTGNSLGYIQMWDISSYCVNVPQSEKPVCSCPPYEVVWKAHVSSIVSIELAEDKGLIITASTDCCVRMWAMNGRYIGTFGEKCPWLLTHPLRTTTLPRKAPPGINKVASFRSIQIMSGPTTSKWKLAKNLFKLLRQSRKKHTALNLFGIETNDLTNPHQLGSGDSTNCSNVLGKCYQRKTRFREPIISTPLKQIDGRLHSIYSTLHCSEIKEPIECTLEDNSAAAGDGDHTPLSECSPLQNDHLSSQLTDDDVIITALKSPHTETSLFQPNPRKVTIVNQL